MGIRRASPSLRSAFAAMVLCGPLFALAPPAPGEEPVQGTALSPRQVLDNLAAKTYSGRRIDLIAANTGLQEVMARLEKAGGMRFEMDPSIDDRVTYRLIDVPWDEALAAVLADNSLHIMMNLEGTGFKIGRGRQVVLSLPDTGRTKIALFLYRHGLEIAVGLILLSVLAAGLCLLVRRRDRLLANNKKPLLPPDAAERVKDELVRLLKDERLYRDAGLTLLTLAEKLDRTPHQLSWVINEELRVSFPSLINGYRVEEVKGRLAEPSSEKTPILQIALEAGFNTKASFNRAFKAHTGMTPSQFKKRLPR
jgi:AraC-like DNA-binding protein